MKEKKAIVVGAGLVGSLWSVFLAKRGYTVEVYERRSDMRNQGFIGGRSINLAMSTRGWKALEMAGIADQIRKDAIPMYGRQMHDEKGNQVFQAYGKEDQAIYSVSRGGLNLALLKIADEHPQVSLHFDQACLGFNRRELEIKFRNEEGTHKKTAPLIFGTDGAFSAIRQSLQKTDRFNFEQNYLEHGYKELRIPPAEGGGFRLEKNALHIWPRGHFMLIALPNPDGSFTCTLFLPFAGPQSFENLKTDEQVLAFFNKYFADVVPIMPELLSDFNGNPTSSLVTIRCNPWTHKDRFMIIGDASHAIVPFYGQGMNSGFEDCTVLNDLMDKHNEDWPAIFEAMNKDRIPDANAISDLALRNFVEMRDLVGDPMFLLRKKIAAWLQTEYPDKFIPLYSQVTFTHIPYHKALAEGQRQDELFKKILSLDNITNDWKTDQVKDIFLDWYAKRPA